LGNKVYYDGISAKRNIAAANKLARDGIKFVIGHPYSDCAVPASDVYENKGVLTISPAATSPELTARGHRLTFRTVGTGDV
jgi:branched-chain amino acid transport system substrate-binding protein